MDQVEIQDSRVIRFDRWVGSFDTSFAWAYILFFELVLFVMQWMGISFGYILGLLVVEVFVLTYIFIATNLFRVQDVK